MFAPSAILDRFDSGLRGSQIVEYKTDRRSPYAVLTRFPFQLAILIGTPLPPSSVHNDGAQHQRNLGEEIGRREHCKLDVSGHGQRDRGGHSHVPRGELRREREHIRRCCATHGANQPAARGMCVPSLATASSLGRAYRGTSTGERAITLRVSPTRRSDCRHARHRAR